MIFIVIIAAVTIGGAGKFLIVTGYDFDLKVIPKKSFYITPFFVNLHSIYGDVGDLTVENIDSKTATMPKLAPDIKKYTDELKHSVKCINNLYVIQQAVDKYLAKNVYNTLKEGEIPWNKIYLFLPNNQKRACPSGGSYYLYKEGSNFKVGCTNHRTIEKPRIRF